MEVFSTNSRRDPMDEDFDVLEEGWNIYKLDDGTTLKHKLVLVRMIREKVDEMGNPEYGFVMQKVFGIIPPEKLRGTPSVKKHSSEELSDSIVAEDINFETIGENWNRYRLKDGVSLDIKPIVTMVSKTDKFDERGDPVYLIQSQAVSRGKIPKEVKEKLREYFKKQSK